MKELSDSTQSKLTAMQDSQAKAEAEAKKRAEALARPKDKQGYLALARAKVKAKDIAVARTLYNEFLQKWPKDALAADAHFELGETYYDEHKCREALFEYGKVIQEFSKSKVTPEAYLHSGQCFGALGMKKESKLALEELVRSYPKSAQARQARKELAAGKKPAPKPTHHKK
jgi:tol-pal system protein YbgF